MCLLHDCDHVYCWVWGYLSQYTYWKVGHHLWIIQNVFWILSDFFKSCSWWLAWLCLQLSFLRPWFWLGQGGSTGEHTRMKEEKLLLWWEHLTNINVLVNSIILGFWSYNVWDSDELSFWFSPWRQRGCWCWGGVPSPWWTRAGIWRFSEKAISKGQILPRISHGLRGSWQNSGKGLDKLVEKNSIIERLTVLMLS